MRTRPWIDNSPLPTAKNKLRKQGEYIEFLINNNKPEQPEVWIKIDEASVSKLAPYSWFIPANGYVSTIIKNRTVAMHRLLLDVLERPDIILEFVGEDKTDYRLSNIRPKSIGNIQRVAEKQQERLTQELVKTATNLMDVSVRKEINQIALSQAANMLAIMISIANDTKAKNSDRLNAANAILNRAIGKDDSESVTPGQLPSISITFTNPPPATVEMEDVEDVHSIDIPIPVFQ